MFDVVIVGAGVSGCAIARELSRRRVRACVVEASEDVCDGTSKANSGIVHAGFDARPGSLMARLNVEGARLMVDLARDLDVRFEQCGSLVVCVSDDTRPGLARLLEQGRRNGVSGLRIIERDELVRMEPNVSDEAVAALWAPTGGIVDPFLLTVALAENAATNGIEFRFGARVTGIVREGSLWRVVTEAGDFVARCVVNAAGVYADQVHNFVAAPDDQLSIVARKGEYYLLDTTAAGHVAHTVFTLPTAMGKGVLVSPTVHGNLIVGPTATDIDDKEATDTTSEGLAEVASRCSRAVRDVPLREVITTFSGLRACHASHDFLIGEVAGAPRFFDCAGIASPGLTSAPAIGVMVAAQVCETLGLVDKADWVAERTAIPDVSRLSLDAWAALCREDPAFGNVVCRCRRVSEAQIVEAMRRPVGGRSLDALKRRTFVTAGRCQGGFCTPKVMELMERELGMAPCDVTKCGPGSELVVGRNKDRVAAPDRTCGGGGA